MQPCKRMIESFMYRYDPPLRMTLPDVGRFFTAKTNLAPNSSKPNPTQRKCLWIEMTIPQKSSYTGNEWWINYRNLHAIPSLYMLKKCIKRSSETRSNITLFDHCASNLPFSIAIPIFLTAFYSFLIIIPRRIKSYIEQNPLINYFTTFSLPFCLATKWYSTWDYSVPSTCSSNPLYCFSRNGDCKFCLQFKVGRITICLGQ